jgi:hypothetical protein
VSQFECGSARPASRSGGDFSGLRGRAPKKNRADRDGSAYVSAVQMKGKNPPAEGLKPEGKMSGKAMVGGPGSPRIIPDRPLIAHPKVRLIHMG